jgi:DinB superfamily
MTANNRDTAVGIFRDAVQAHRAMQALQAAGFAASDTSRLQFADEHSPPANALNGAVSTQVQAACAGALVGALIGGMLGAAATGLIPAINPVLPVEEANLAVVGAEVGGGALGALAGLGLSTRGPRAGTREAEGRVMLIVRANNRCGEARTILRHHGAYSPELESEDPSHTRAHRLAARFEQENSELVAFVEGCSEGDWQVTGHHRADGDPLILDWSRVALCTHESWSVGFVAYHIAQDHPLILDWIQVVVGRQPDRVPFEILDLVGGQHTDQHASANTAQYRKEEALALLRRNGAQVLSLVESLSDEDLAAVTAHPLRDDRVISVQTIVEQLLIGHVKLHRAGIRAAVGS